MKITKPNASLLYFLFSDDIDLVTIVISTSSLLCFSQVSSSWTRPDLKHKTIYRIFLLAHWTGHHYEMQWNVIKDFLFYQKNFFLMPSPFPLPLVNIVISTSLQYESPIWTPEKLMLRSIIQTDTNKRVYLIVEVGFCYDIINTILPWDDLNISAMINLNNAFWMMIN